MKPVEDARTNFAQAKGQLEKAFAGIPDDRLNWSPSETARTPVEIVAHSAEALFHIAEMIDGRPFYQGPTADADAEFRERERDFKTREAALELLEKNSSILLDVLDRLTPERLDSEMATLPFGLGQAPIAMVLGAPADHTRWHAAQLEYIQTIYGDRDWRL